MQYIIVDFEMTRDGKRGVYHKHSEIIEIGAVRVVYDDADNTYTIADEYKSLVRPKDTVILEDIANLTGITNEMVISERFFEEVLPEFLDWIGKEETVIYSWSLSDYYQLNNESLRKDVQSVHLTKLLGNWKDLQKEFGDILRVEQSIKLSYALNAANLSFEGQAHDGLMDARNTAKLFILSRDTEELKRRMATIIELFAPKKTLSSSIASFFPEGFSIEQ